jgi:hypothetical protein
VLVAALTRLVTLVETEGDVADARRMSVSVRQEAVLADGRRLLLLGERGWSSSLHGPGDVWAQTSVEEIENTARIVVGPDEPPAGLSWADVEADHWAYLADALRQQGVAVDAVELQQLPHDVVLGRRLLAHVGRNRGEDVSPRLLQAAAAPDMAGAAHRLSELRPTNRPLTRPFVFDAAPNRLVLTSPTR